MPEHSLDSSAALEVHDSQCECARQTKTENALLWRAMCRTAHESKIHNSFTCCWPFCTLASTGTIAPAKTFTSSGVITIAPTVDAVVISTDSATSPCAMYVATFDA